MPDVNNARLVLRSVYFTVLRNNIQTHGIAWVTKKLVRRALMELAWVCLLPVAITLHFAGVRRALVRIEHIGHLAAEIDCYVKEKRLNSERHNGYFYFLLAPGKRVSNQHLLRYWKPYIFIVSNSIACMLLSLLTHRYFMRMDVSRYIGSFFGQQDIYQINHDWADREPILQLSHADEIWSQTNLLKLGIQPSQKYVCLHVREGGYLPHNELIQSHRNASILNMIPSIKSIIARGYLVIRMGDPTMSLLPPMDGVIDYAHHSLKSERMDVVLCAKASFFLGCTSGLSFVSMIFGVPVAQANMIPVEALAIRHCDVSIPKLLWSLTHNRYLTFPEILSCPVGGYYFTNQYVDSGVRPVENLPDDILCLTDEILDRIENKFICTDDDCKLHDQYMSLLKPHHYSYGAASNISFGFLRRYRHLFAGDYQGG